MGSPVGACTRAADEAAVDDWFHRFVTFEHRCARQPPRCVQRSCRARVGARRIRVAGRPDATATAARAVVPSRWLARRCNDGTARADHRGPSRSVVDGARCQTVAARLLAGERLSFDDRDLVADWASQYAAEAPAGPPPITSTSVDDVTQVPAGEPGAGSVRPDRAGDHGVDVLEGRRAVLQRSPRRRIDRAPLVELVFIRADGSAPPRVNRSWHTTARICVGATN